MRIAVVSTWNYWLVAAISVGPNENGMRLHWMRPPIFPLILSPFSICMENYGCSSDQLNHDYIEIQWWANERIENAGFLFDLKFFYFIFIFFNFFAFSSSILFVCYFYCLFCGTENMQYYFKVIAEYIYKDNWPLFYVSALFKPMNDFNSGKLQQQSTNWIAINFSIN